MIWKEIEKSLELSFTYEEYHEQIKVLVDSKSSSGPKQSESYVNFTKLNDRRAKRLDKTATLTPKFEEFVSKISSPQTWLVITESWCGDAVQALPFFNLASKLNENIQLKLVYRDENENLIDLFLTNGGRSIPKLLILDSENKKVITDWGPRPKDAQEMYLDFKKNPNGRVYQDIQIDLQKWYLQNKGVMMQSEILNLLG